MLVKLKLLQLLKGWRGRPGSHLSTEKSSTELSTGDKKVEIVAACIVLSHGDDSAVE